MYTLRRVTAYIIDNIFILLVFLLTIPFISETLTAFDGTGKIFPAIIFLIGLFGPLLILGAFSGKWGVTPGKFICQLTIKSSNGENIGIPMGFFRELTKAILLGSIFGIILALVTIIMNKQSFYDSFFGIEVDRDNNTQLTETQKKWRREMGKLGHVPGGFQQKEGPTQNAEVVPSFTCVDCEFAVNKDKFSSSYLFCPQCGSRLEEV